MPGIGSACLLPRSASPPLATRRPIFYVLLGAGSMALLTVVLFYLAPRWLPAGGVIIHVGPNPPRDASRVVHAAPTPTGRAPAPPAMAPQPAPAESPPGPAPGPAATESQASAPAEVPGRLLV